MSLPLPESKVDPPVALPYSSARDAAVEEAKHPNPDRSIPHPESNLLAAFYHFVGVKDKDEAWDRLACAALEWIPYTVRLNPDHKPRLLMGGILWAVAMAIFLALFITSYQTHAHTSYLSLTDSIKCEAVTKTTSETFYADEQGSWSTQPDYQSALTWYALQLNDAQLTDDEYTRFMTQSLKYLQGNASQASEYTAAEVLLLLFTWRSTSIGAAVNSTPSAMLYIAADPVYTFSLTPFNYFYASNSTGYHGGFTSLYNINGNSMLFRTNNVQYVKTIAQSTATSLKNSNNLSEYIAQIGFNLQSFFVAAAINRGLLSFNVLQSGGTGRYTAMPSNFAVYKDPRYPSMDPIYCDQTVQRCVLHVYPWGFGNLTGAYYPLFAEGDLITECTCPVSTYDENGCYYLDFNLALAYLGQSSDTKYPFRSNVWENMGKDTTGKVWEYLVNRQYYSSDFYFAFDFYIWTASNGIEVNDFFTSIVEPQCSSANVLPNSSAISTMEKTTPTDLSEKYLECKYTTGETWQYALGIAAGQFHVYMVCAVLVVVYSFKLIFECCMNARVEFKPNFIVTYSIYRDFLEQQRQKDEGRNHVAHAEYRDAQV